MKKDDKGLLQEIRERWDEAWSADESNRHEAESDLRFVSGEQWPHSVKVEREADNRPCITENNLPQFIRQIVGDMRAQRPAIKVQPDGGGAEKKVADIYSGLIRDIEAKAATKRPYITGGASAVRCGIGHWRVLHDYESDQSFNQCIKLDPIDNPFAVVWDPLATEITRQDARYCFVTDLMAGDVFEAEYPDAQPVDFDGQDEVWAGNWYDQKTESVRVAEYWHKKPIRKKLLMLGDGSTYMSDKLPKGLPVNIIKERDIDSFEVWCVKTNGFEILEDPTRWPTKHIPIVAVVGEEYAIGETRVRHSAIRFAKEPQQLYNYWLSTQTEHLALQPKAPFIATEKQIGPYKQMWQEANEKNRPVLIYAADPQAPGAPQRQQPPAQSVGMSEQILRAQDAMKATTGIYSAGLGEQSNETSGKAILARQRESDVGSSEFLDNLAASVAYTGEIIIDLIPFIYDNERQVRVLAEDGAESFAMINQEMQGPEGVELQNALARGTYAVHVTTGPSYTTKRQEAAESMLAFVQANPESASIVMDLVAKNMDWPGAQEFSERFKKMLPPNLQPKTDDPEEQQALQEAAAKAQEAEGVQKQMIGLEMGEKAAAIEKTRAETQKIMTGDPGEQAFRAAELELEQQKLRNEWRKLDIEEQKLKQAAREVEVNAMIEMARLQDSEKARDTESARASAEMEIQSAPIRQTDEVIGAMVKGVMSMGQEIRAGFSDMANAYKRPRRLVKDPMTGEKLAVVE